MRSITLPKFENDPSGQMKIKDLNQYSRGVSLVVKVDRKTETRTVTVRSDNSEHLVCEALIADESGAVYVSLWDNQIEEIQPGMFLAIRNAYMNAFRGSMRLNLGRYGSFEILEETPFEEVNLENNISETKVEYDDPRKGNTSNQGASGGRSYGSSGRRY
jgi:replication factor A1